MNFIFFQLLGVIAACMLISLIHLGKRSARKLLAFGLVVAALIYVGFALTSQYKTIWLLAELCGVLIFTGFALAGLRHSAWWLIIGWALHAVWDVALHLHGPIQGVAPSWYAHLCLAFDLVVAAYLWIYYIKRKPNIGAY
jgi:hypothetical protein